MASQSKSSRQAQPIITSTCFKAELSKMVTRCLSGMDQFYSSDCCKYDIDQGYQKQPDCDKYWHRKP